MTILSVVREACGVIGLDPPDVLYSSTVREHIELRSIVQSLTEQIVQGHDWRALCTVATVTGDGSTESFDLPLDYNRMLKKARVWSSSLETSFSAILDLDQWLELDIQSFDFVVNAWTIYADQIHIKPALASGVTAKYFYVSDAVVKPATGANKASFTYDTDTFRIDDALLKYGLIWRWKEYKGLPYEEALADYETHKARLITADAGSKMLTVGRPRLPSDVSIAYPRAIAP